MFNSVSTHNRTEQLDGILAREKQIKVLRWYGKINGITGTNTRFDPRLNEMYLDFDQRRVTDQH